MVVEKKLNPGVNGTLELLWEHTPLACLNHYIVLIP